MKEGEKNSDKSSCEAATRDRDNRSKREKEKEK